jgi:hypothetical protein
VTHSIKALGCIVTSIAGIPDKQNVSYGHEVKEAVVYGSVYPMQNRGAPYAGLLAGAKAATGVSARNHRQTTGATSKQKTAAALAWRTTL